MHLEGPYINPGKLGAQPDAAVSAVLDEVLKYLSIAPIRVVTLAPEIAGHIEIIGEMARAACACSSAIRSRPTTTRWPRSSTAPAVSRTCSTRCRRCITATPVGAALAHAEYAEIIPDLLHVHPGAIRAALRAIPRLYVVTDSTSATGMPTANTGSAAST